LRAGSNTSCADKADYQFSSSYSYLLLFEFLFAALLNSCLVHVCMS